MAISATVKCTHIAAYTLTVISHLDPVSLIKLSKSDDTDIKSSNSASVFAAYNWNGQKHL